MGEESCFWSGTPSRTALLGRDSVTGAGDTASAVVISRDDDNEEGKR